MADPPIKNDEAAQSKHATHEVPFLDHAPKSVLEDGSLDPVYAAKARVLNKAIQEIGMGRYQWQLFIVIGFGWAMVGIIAST